MKNPYETLGVDKAASQDDIRKAYRKLAKKLHPDINPGDATAEARFKEVSAAYDFLADEEKRRRFDAGEIDASGAERQRQGFYRDFARSGAAGAYQDASGFSDFMDADGLFAELLRRQGRRRGADIHARLAVDFLDAVNGAVREVALAGGKPLSVTIPAGIEDGQVLRLAGRGMPAAEGEAGDALIEISVRPHKHFTRQGSDILLDLPITLKEAVLGSQVRAPTPTGPVMLTVPKAASTGRVLRLRGKGVAAREAQGDLLVTLRIVPPQRPEPELEAFLASWKPLHEDDPRREMNG